MKQAREQLYAEESNVIVLDPDVSRIFTSAESVNRALRATLARIIEKQPKSLAPAVNLL